MNNMIMVLMCINNVKKMMKWLVNEVIMIMNNDNNNENDWINE